MTTVVLSPVPPRVPASVPTQEGVNVCVEPTEEIVRLIFASEPVANVCARVESPLSEVMPVVSVIQLPFTAKHPVARLIPSANDEVAEPTTLRRFVWIPPVNVEVAVEVAMMRFATMSPATESFAYGDEVPIPTLPDERKVASVILFALRSRMFPAPV